ncbi:MAG: cytochrome P450 [Chloroflexota bacterium]
MRRISVHTHYALRITQPKEPYPAWKMPTYDLFSRTFKVDPHPTFAQMRHEDPVYSHIAPNGLRIWYITRYDDIVTVLRNNDWVVKNIENTVPEPASLPQKPGHAVLRLINQNMLFADPPDHTRLRALVTQAFTPRRIEALAEQIQQFTDRLLDQVAPQGEMELIHDLAYPLPMLVITAMLGVPEEDGDQVREWSKAIISPGSHGINWRQRKRKIRAFVEYIDDMAQQRLESPQDDLLTALVQAEESGGKLSPEELSSMVVLLLVTGHDTVVNLIGNGAVTLLRHPEQLGLLREQPLLWPTAIEEILRYDGPVETSTTRWAKTDFELHGHQIKRGDLVRVVLTSANRDATQFEQPNVFDVQRQNNRHIGFGFGIHYCLGAPLARLEGQITLSTLFNRFPNIRLAIPDADINWRSGVLFRGPKTLPLIWD